MFCSELVYKFRMYLVSMKIHVVTVATHKERYFDTLVQSANNMNVKLVVLGMNQKWDGFHMKYTLVYDYIADLPLDDMVVFVDAFDSLILRNFDTFADDFNEINHRWVIPAVQEPEDVLKAYVAHHLYGPGEILVTCQWAAKVETLKQDIPKLLKIMEGYFVDDQSAMNRLHKENPETTMVYSDVNGRLFTLDMDTAMNGASYSVSAPMNEDLDNVCRRLHLTPPERITATQYWLHPKNLTYLKYFKIEATIIFILFLLVLWFLTRIANSPDLTFSNVFHSLCNYKRWS